MNAEKGDDNSTRDTKDNELVSENELDTDSINDNINDNVDDNIDVIFNVIDDIGIGNQDIKINFDEGNILVSDDLFKTLSDPIPPINQRKESEFVLVKEGVGYTLYMGENTIGRNPDNDFVLEDNRVSRKHATLIVFANKVEIKDHSLHGSCINFEMINKQTICLRISDEIGIFGSVYTLERKPKEKNLFIADIVNEIKLVQNASKQRTPYLQAGFSLIELLIVVIVIGIISAISVANLVSSRRAANGASAVQSMRVIASSQASYQAGVGNGEFALPSSLLNQQYIDQSVASACLPTPTTNQTPKSGYIFVFNTTESNASSDTLASFSVSARPIVVNGIVRSGNRSFFVDQTGVLRLSTNVSILADANSQPLQ